MKERTEKEKKRRKVVKKRKSDTISKPQIRPTK